MQGHKLKGLWPGFCPCVTSTSHAVHNALGLLPAVEMAQLPGQLVESASCDTVNELRLQEFISTELSDKFVPADVLEV
jgi:hypothetical protein